MHEREARAYVPRGLSLAHLDSTQTRIHLQQEQERLLPVTSLAIGRAWRCAAQLSVLANLSPDRAAEAAQRMVRCLGAHFPADSSEFLAGLLEARVWLQREGAAVPGPDRAQARAWLEVRFGRRGAEAFVRYVEASAAAVVAKTQEIGA